MYQCFNIWKKEKNMIKGIIFDLDGTLADTVDDIGDAVNMMLAARGFPTLERETHIANIGNGAYTLICRSLPQAYAGDGSFVRECLEEFKEYYSCNYMNKSRAFEGVREALLTLREKDIALSVLSNKPDDYVQRMIPVIFPDIAFDYVQGQGALQVKPDPTAALEIAKGMGLKPDTVAFVGDSDVDMITAKNAGMKAVGVCWGYRPSEVLLSLGAELLCREASDIAAIPERLN